MEKFFPKENFLVFSDFHSKWHLSFLVAKSEMITELGFCQFQYISKKIFLWRFNKRNKKRRNFFLRMTTIFLKLGIRTFFLVTIKVALCHGKGLNWIGKVVSEWSDWDCGKRCKESIWDFWPSQYLLFRAVLRNFASLVIYSLEVRRMLIMEVLREGTRARSFQ